MASKRITELTSLTAQALVVSDILHIIDNSASVSGKNKKITVQALLSGAGGSEPLPYKHKEEFKFNNSDSTNALNSYHLWVAPPTSDFINVARVRVWSGGGGGGGGNNLGNSGGGGGGGSYAEKLFTYVPNRTYAIYVGTNGSGGAGGSSNDNGSSGSTGGSSYLCDLSAASTDTSAIPVLALHALSVGGAGGSGAQSSSGGGAGGDGGSNASCVGDVVKSGASGSQKGSGGRLGGSGGGSYRGGRGGVGCTTIDGDNNRVGNSPAAGGGGGGPHSTQSSKSGGANGAPGLVTVEYNADVSDYSSTSYSP